MLSLIIVDDEPKARSTIGDILNLSEQKLNILGEAGDVRSAHELILQKKPAKPSTSSISKILFVAGRM